MTRTIAAALAALLAAGAARAQTELPPAMATLPPRIPSETDVRVPAVTAEEIADETTTSSSSTTTSNGAPSGSTTASTRVSESTTTTVATAAPPPVAPMPPMPSVPPLLPEPAVPMAIVEAPAPAPLLVDQPGFTPSTTRTVFRRDPKLHPMSDVAARLESRAPMHDSSVRMPPGPLPKPRPTLGADGTYNGTVVRYVP